MLEPTSHGGEAMIQTIKARYHQGKIEPLEPLELDEGAEVVVTVSSDAPPPSGQDTILATAGAWKDALDCEALEEDVYESRLLQTRPEVQW
jgi:predicted DNA-binding antitoxin AbrB/MazE fold protein